MNFMQNKALADMLTLKYNFIDVRELMYVLLTYGT